MLTESPGLAKVSKEPGAGQAGQQRCLRSHVWGQAGWQKCPSSRVRGRLPRCWACRLAVGLVGCLWGRSACCGACRLAAGGKPSQVRRQRKMISASILSR
eukprot:358454-Chlamydomonas_euryale.AAC.6